MPSSKRYFDMLPSLIQKIYKSYQNNKIKTKWIKEGKGIPVPHIIKQELVLEYKNKHKLYTLIESGTYLGDMVWAQQKNFDKIYSIELNKNLHEKAKKRFKSKKHIQIIQGDSGKLMSTIVKEINGEALFWLDGHYSGGKTARGDKDCPIWEELKAICATGDDHVLLIDDARLFIGERDYPTTNGVKTYIYERYPNSKFTIKDDIIIVELQK